MFIVVMLGRWSDDSACLVVHDVRWYSVLDTVLMVNNMFGTLVSGVWGVCD